MCGLRPLHPTAHDRQRPKRLGCVLIIMIRVSGSLSTPLPVRVVERDSFPVVFVFWSPTSPPTNLI